MQQTEDWTQDKDNVYKYDNYAARDCIKEDFNEYEEDVQIFESWAGFKLLCPDLREDSRVQLYNKLGDMYAKSFVFSIEKCVGTTPNGEECYGDTEIEKFISDLSIDFWSIESFPNWGEFH